MSINLFPHQRTAVDKMHNGCVLVGGVGTGKSLTSIAYYYEKVCEGIIGVYGSMEAPKDLYIITTAKKRDSLDWEADAIGFGLGKDAALNHQGVSITVDSWNNISKYKDTKGAFFIFDESRIVGSGAWVKAFLTIAKSNQWVLLSATPGDTWLDYIPLFLANGFYKNRTAFKREHVVYSAYSKFPKVERYIATGKLVRLRNQITVQMPYERHTKRHLVDVDVSYDKDLYEKVVKDRWHVYEERPLRDISEMFSVMRKVVNSDESRLRSLERLLEKHPRVIVFYNFNYELEMLRSMGEELRSSETTSSTKTPSSQSTFSTPSSSPTTGSKTQPPSPKTPTTKSGSSTTSDSLRRETSNSPGCPPSKNGVETTNVRCGMWTSDDGRGEMWIPCTPKMRVCGGETPWECQAVSTSRRTSSTASPQTLEKGSASESSTISEKDAQSPSKPDTLEENSSSSFAIAEWNGQKHESIPSTDRWLYLVQYMAGAEGWNCTDTNAVVFYSQTYSYKQFEQAQGRIDRLNTPFVDLYYYNLLSKASIDGAIRRALKSKKSFNERDFEM